MIICLHKGTSLISKAIFWKTWGVYSHASLLMDEQTIYEAKEWVGVGHNKAQSFEDVDFYHVATNTRENESLIDFMIETYKCEYDYPSIGRFITRRKETLSSKNKWFCSEWIFMAALRAHHLILARIPAYKVSPTLLSYSNDLAPIEYETVFQNLDDLCFTQDQLARYHNSIQEI